MFVKVKKYYGSVFTPGMAIFVNKATKRDIETIELNVEWFRLDDVTYRYVSMGVNQDMVVKKETFSNEWRELKI